MSLVSEALRKARQDAAIREAAARGVPIEVVTRQVRSGPGPWLVVAAAAVIAAALGGALVAWWLLAAGTRPGRAADGAAPSPAPARAPVATAAPGSPPVAAAGQLAAAPASLEPPAAPIRRPATPAAATAVAAGLAGRTGAPEVQPGTNRAAQPATTDAASIIAPAAPPEKDAVGPPQPRSALGTAPTAGPERTFVVDADLGYARVHLDWLVDRPGSPFARVNGQDVVEGSTVAGFVVEAIRGDHVRLRDARGALVLRVR